MLDCQVFQETMDLCASTTRHQALTAALSEKDAHLALLEVGGVRSSRAAQEVETLNKEKAKLLESMKHLVTLQHHFIPFHLSHVFKVLLIFTIVMSPFIYQYYCFIIKMKFINMYGINLFKTNLFAA